MKVFMGGTFDPVHLGHLRMAVELSELLMVPQVYLMPCAQPSHREQPQTSTYHRLQMLKLATANNARLAVDEREINRSGPTYTIDSLREMRAEIGVEDPLCMVMGSDAFQWLGQWKEADQLSRHCHIIKISRPGHPVPNDLPLIQSLGFQFSDSLQALRQAAFGLIQEVSLTPLEISSSDIRRRLCQGFSIRYLVTDDVWHYICDNGLY